MDLFENQNKNVSAMRNWVGNYKLFFGLFHLMMKNIGPIAVIGILICMIFGKRIEVENIDRSSNLKRINKFKNAFIYGSEVSVFNLMFLKFAGFSLLSSIFL